jgi:flavin-dependent dehydrogenase
MAPDRYDVIVIGARCAGSPTAMLLARQGHRVLLVDRATFPSDTLSTHVVHPPGVAALDRWGVLDPLRATNCPPIDTYSFDFGPFTLAGAPGTPDSPVAYCPRRTVLDKLLVDAAAESGVEVREAFTVDEIEFEMGASPASVGTRRVVGPSSSTATWWWGPTAVSRCWRRRSAPSSTTNAARSSAGTTRTGAGSRPKAASR